MDSAFIHYIFRLLFALFIGGLIGIEREVKGKPAGMRTNMLMCMGSCLLMILSIEIFEQGTWFGDPSRIASQVVTGIGFLGAGMIIQSRFSVAGLTSAATLWFVAALGMVIGWGLYFIASAATILTIATLTLLSGIERLVAVRRRHHILQFEFPKDMQPIPQVKSTFATLHITPENVSLRRGKDHIIVDLDYTSSEKGHARLLEALRGISGVDITLDY
jgi:putative Mg2+ transporter-C (MgtC) family protein